MKTLRFEVISKNLMFPHEEKTVAAFEEKAHADRYCKDRNTAYELRAYDLHTYDYFVVDLNEGTAN